MRRARVHDVYNRIIMVVNRYTRSHDGAAHLRQLRDTAKYTTELATAAHRGDGIIATITDVVVL